jgi:hypothetical protein
MQTALCRPQTGASRRAAWFRLGRLAMLVFAAMPVGAVPARQPSLEVDAGLPRTLAFPATDLTLFGHARAPENRPLVVRWTQVGGPAPVRFSAPCALTTTASFSATGRYVLRLTAREGGRRAISTVAVRVDPASSQRAFYVDPDYAGDGDGSAGRPWRALASSPTGPEWSAVNRALAHGPVIIYFSAREAREDVPEETTSEVNVLRTDKSTHRLTLDGMSRYNADDAQPSWRDYAGPCKLRIKILRGALSIGCHGTEPQYPMHYVTVRGFEVTGSSGRVVFGGNHVVMEHMYIHDITAVGANLQFHGSVESDGKESFGRLKDITIRGNRIERGEGEGIYVAGNYRTKAYGGWPEYGNTHWDVLIEGNTIRDAGLNGGEGDGIDVKTGIRNVTIRGNTIERLHPMPEITGIICEGVFGDARSDLLIEANRVSGAGTGIGFGGQNGAIVRNNVISDCAHRGIAAWGDPGVRNYHVQVENNTLVGNGGGIGIGGCTDVSVRNNLVIGDARSQTKGSYQLTTYDSTGIASDYNLFCGPGPEPGWPEGPHSRTVSGGTGLVMDLERRDLRLAPHSPAIDRGVDLSGSGFASDFRGIPRPQGRAWDIGAYERKVPAALGSSARDH